VLFVQIQRPVRFKTSPQTRFCTILKTWTDPPGERNGGCNTFGWKLSHCSMAWM